jgi:apolipoprotein N-acyltransferase
MLPACWMLAEMGQRRASLGLTWALAGQPLADWPVLSQAAALAGPESLSFLVLATNVSLALWLRRCSRWSRLAALAQGPGLLVLAAVWGAQHDGAAAHADANDSIDVAVIQPNASAAMKQDLSQRGDLLEHYDRLVNRTLGESPQLIVLPEGALPGLVRYDDGLTDWARSTVIRTGLPLLFGSIDHPEGEAQRLFNVAVLITPYNTVATYAKTRLVPLAEYVPAPGPLRSWASALRGDLVDYAPGEELTLFELGESVRFGVMICYEDVFADLGRAYANAGATMLVALVNTQSFDRSAQPLQHLRRARLTAISAGLPMIRCGNSGVSAMIDPYGRIRGTVRDALGRPVGVPAARVLTVPLTARATTYRRLGDGPIAIMVGLYAIMILVARRRMGHPAVSTESLLIPRPSE